MKFNLQPDDKKRLVKVETDLLKALKTAHYILRALLNQLVKVGFHKYPYESVENICSELNELAILVSEFGCDCREFKNDISRLVSAKEKFNTNLTEEEAKITNEKQVKLDEKGKSILSSNRANSINIINNLARQKFGPAKPRSPKKINLKKQKVIIPKGNRNLEQRVLHSQNRTARTDDFPSSNQHDIISNL